MKFEDFEKALITHHYVTKNRKYSSLARKIFEKKGISLEVAYNTIWSKELKKEPFIPFAQNSNRFTFIDLFAGIGGFRLALQRFGGKCLFSSEWNSSARKTYFQNYGEYPFGDISDSTIKKIIPKKFNILCGGFPCQPFSRAGVSARQSLGLEHGFDHPTQGNLFFEIVNIVKVHTPDVLFLENVKNLKTHDKGNTFRVIEESVVFSS